MKKYENFCRALENLKDIEKYEEPYENVVLTGMVALFEICFEQAWKAMKELMTEWGIREAETGSPRDIIKLAYKYGMILDGEVWMKALLSRNNVAHAYNQKIACDIIKNTKEEYISMFMELREKMEVKD